MRSVLESDGFPDCGTAITMTQATIHDVYTFSTFTITCAFGESVETEQKGRPVNDAPRTPEGYALDAAPDAPDIRDWIYRPTLSSPPDELIPEVSRITILDQGKEEPVRSCTESSAKRELTT